MAFAKLQKVWRDAKPWQRRNIVASGALMAWGAFLIVDMYYLKKDTRVREKFKLDEKPEQDY